jgi:hypothetical protein
MYSFYTSIYIVLFSFFSHSQVRTGPTGTLNPTTPEKEEGESMADG